MDQPVGVIRVGPVDQPSHLAQVVTAADRRAQLLESLFSLSDHGHVETREFLERLDRESSHVDTSDHRHRIRQDVLDQRSRVSGRLDLVGERGQAHDVGCEFGDARLDLGEVQSFELGVHHEDLDRRVPLQPTGEVGQRNPPPVRTIVPGLDNRQRRRVHEDHS